MTKEYKDLIEIDEEELNSKYLISCEYVMYRGKYTLEENIDSDWLDIFEYCPLYYNIGTFTHWMELPNEPENGEVPGLKSQTFATT